MPKKTLLNSYKWDVDVEKKIALRVKIAFSERICSNKLEQTSQLITPVGNIFNPKVS